MVMDALTILWSFSFHTWNLVLQSSFCMFFSNTFPISILEFLRQRSKCFTFYSQILVKAPCFSYLQNSWPYSNGRPLNLARMYTSISIYIIYPHSFDQGKCFNRYFSLKALKRFHVLTLTWVGFLGVHFLKLVRIMLETWNLVCKCTNICGFRKYTF